MKKKKIYNPSDSRKRRYVSSMRNRILAGVVAAVTAATPAVTYAADFGGYGLLNILGTDTGTESVEDDSGTVEVSSVTDVEESVEDVTKLAEDSEKSGEETETKFLFINLSGAEHGKIILNEGEDDERCIKLVKQTSIDDAGNETEEMMINVYDKDDVLISTESAADNNYIYVCEAEVDRAVTAKVVPDDGYLVSKYSLQDKLIDGVDENVGFEETDSEFSFPIFMKDNMSLSIEFTEKEVKSDENDKNEISTDESSNKTTDEASSETSGSKADTDAVTIVTDDDAKDNEPDLSVKNEAETSNEDGEAGTSETISGNDASHDDELGDVADENQDITVNDSSTESGETVDEMASLDEENTVNDETKEAVVDNDSDVFANLDSSEFESARLIVLTDSDNIIDKEYVIGNYDNIYLLQYETPSDAMNAYTYYLENADAVEPDTEFETADDKFSENLSSDDIDGDNALDVLSEQTESEAVNNAVSNDDKVIALIDTGVSENSNVIDRISLIDDQLSGNGHGDQMVAAITSQDSDAKILSIRTMGNDGKGKVSAVVAGMEYAIEHNVNIINMSMYAKKSLANSVIESEIQKAISAGIEVVGSAGNDSADAKGYMPGSIEPAWIIGAANEDGSRLNISNYGDTVDYNVVATSTSEAAAKFSGYIAKNGVADIQLNTGIIFAADYATKDENDAVKNEIIKENKKDLEYELKNDKPQEEDTPEGCPELNTTIYKEEKVWTKDEWYDFKTYNPYGDVASVECETEVGELSYKDGDSFECEYTYTLNEDDSYQWFADVTFIFVDDRDLASVKSEKAKNLLPSMVTQDRNEGYSGIVPESCGETVDGGTYTAILGNHGFSLEGILLPYNPQTFKVNGFIDDGGFNIDVAGTYNVIYEMSYFMYPDYTWNVKTEINVVDIDSLTAGFYLTSRESTLTLTRDSDNKYGGYGNLFQLVPEDVNLFRVSCIDDEEYNVGMVSSDDSINPNDFCTVVNNDDNSKSLNININGLNTEKAVILSVERPGYVSAKAFNGGGWKEQNYSEGQIEKLTDNEFSEFEDNISTGNDADNQSLDDIMEVAAGWTTVGSKSVSVNLQAGEQTGHSYGWDGSIFACSNYGTIKATSAASSISKAVSKIDSSVSISTDKIKNYNVYCASGHDYMGMPVGATYNTTTTVTVQKSGNSYRIRLSTYFQPASDSRGNYQAFYGSIWLEGAETGLTLEFQKTISGAAADDISDSSKIPIPLSSDRIAGLKATFALYNNPDLAQSHLVKSLQVKASSNASDYNKTHASVQINNLEVRDYWLVETGRIGGCTFNSDVYHLHFTKKMTSPVKFQDALVWDTPNQYENANHDYDRIYNNPIRYRGELFRKLCGTSHDNASPVAGAVFQVEYSSAMEDTADNVDSFKQKGVTYYKWYFKTDADGKVVYDADHLLKTWTNPNNGVKYTSDKLIYYYDQEYLPLGMLRAKEMYAPAQYEMNNNTFYFRVEAICEYDTSKNSYTGPVTSKKARLCYAERINGKWVLNWSSKNGEFWCERPRTTANVPETNRGCIFNQLKSVQIQVKKASFASAEVLGLSGYSLANAEFEVWDSQTGGNKVQLYRDKALTTKVDKLVTNDKGKTSAYYIRANTGTNTYWVRETKAPAGHYVHTPLSVTYTLPADGGKLKTVSFTGSNAEDVIYDKMGAFVHKLDTKGNPVAGAIFEVRLYDGVYKTVAECQKYTPKKTWYLKSDTDGNVIFDARHLANDFKPSDSFYKDKNGEIKIPINCTVTFQEVKVPSEYKIDETVQLWSEKNQVVEVKKYYNYLNPCKINIRKLAEDGRTPLEGVEFELTFTKESEPYTDDALRSYSPLLKQGESIKATTDKDGYITWKNLDQGEYQIVETKTHDDMTLLKDPIKVTLPITMTDKQAKEMSAATDQGKFDDYTNKWYFYEATFEVTNNVKFKMPMTGDNGFWKFGFIGFGTIAVLGTGFIIFDKKGKKQKHRKRVTKK